MEQFTGSSSEQGSAGPSFESVDAGSSAGPSVRQTDTGSFCGQMDVGSSFVQMDTRLQQAEMFKEAGNRSYKEKRFRDAISRYHRALLQLKGMDPSVPSPLQAFGAECPIVTPEQEKALHNMQRDCYNNLAACLLHSEPVPYARVKHYSLLVLQRQPCNAKALYRAGVACYHLRDFDRAQQYLEEAQQIQPTDPNVKKYIKLTESELSGYRQQEKQLYRGMFKQ